MSPFWASLFDHLKDCGRRGTIFMIALGGFFGALIIGVFAFRIVHAEEFQPYAAPVLAGIGLIAAIQLRRWIRRTLSDRNHRLRHPPLSRDELRVARERLLRSRNTGNAGRSASTP